MSHHTGKPLSSTYFTQITSKTDASTRKTYTVYSPKRSTLVLFSAVTQEPLASIMFQAHRENIAQPNWNDAAPQSFANTVIYPRTNDADGRQNFQAVVDKDAQYAEYVLTNLCDEGDIDFNLMPTSEPVREKDPGGLNQINELHPNQSCKIYCDQTRNNAKMILEGVTRATVDLATGSVTMAPVSVGQDEDEVVDKRKTSVEGTRYFLSVVPQTGVKSLRDSFAKTFWKAVDMIIIEREGEGPQAPPAPRMRGGNRGGDDRDGNARGPVEICPWYPSPAMGSVPQSFRSYQLESAVVPMSFRSSEGELQCCNNSMIRSFAPPAAAGSAMRSRGAADGLGAFKKLGGGGAGVSKSAVAKSNKPAASRRRDEDEEDGCEEEDELEMVQEKSVKKKSRRGGESEGAQAPSLGTALARSTQAARVRAGGYAEVCSGVTDNDYVYDLASFPCVLGVSVSCYKEQVLAPAQWFEYGTAVPPLIGERVEAAYQAWIASGRHASHGIFSMEVAHAPNTAPTLFAVTFAAIKELPAARNTSVDAAALDMSSTASSASSSSAMPPGGLAVVAAMDATAEGNVRFTRRAPSVRVLGGLFMTEAPPQSTLLERANEMITHVAKKKEAALLDSMPKFQSDACCVCMSEPATMLVALCGHICLCNSKACFEPITKACPICRGHITAKLLCA